MSEEAANFSIKYNINIWSITD